MVLYTEAKKRENECALDSKGHHHRLDTIKKCSFIILSEIHTIYSYCYALWIFICYVFLSKIDVEEHQRNANIGNDESGKKCDRNGNISANGKNKAEKLSQKPPKALNTH